MIYKYVNIYKLHYHTDLPKSVQSLGRHNLLEIKRGELFCWESYLYLYTTEEALLSSDRPFRLPEAGRYWKSQTIEDFKQYLQSLQIEIPKKEQRFRYLLENL